MLIFLRRKASTKLSKENCKVRCIRFMGDVSPEDFTNPDNYNKVNKYVKKCIDKKNLSN